MAAMIQQSLVDFGIRSSYWLLYTNLTNEILLPVIVILELFDLFSKLRLTFLVTFLLLLYISL